MRTELLDYPLPEEQIARRPLAERDAARLLVVGPGEPTHARVADFAELVPQGALVVLNDTRVRRARVSVRKESGGQVELLLLDRAPDAGRASSQGNRELWSALAHANRPLRPGARLSAHGARFEIIERTSDGTVLVAAEAEGGLEPWLERHGSVPLPPYIRRAADEDDAVRYQTVFAKALGSAAAPTAGLHLTPRTLERLAERGVSVACLTLHVGAGTFLPVRTDDLDQHPMHSEPFSVSPALRDAVASARRRGAPVVAVGTTVVRALESAADPEAPGSVRACAESTRLLIQPGYRFRVVDALLTNFHAPRSTLLALVAAFVGYERCQDAYRAALAANYRFLSYGDAMWIPERLAS